jgi:hypothetical protein
MSNTMDEPLFVEEPLLIVEEPLLLTVGGSIPHPAPVDILDDDMEGAIVYYGLIPVGVDWTDSNKSVQQYFQPIAGKTKTQVPKCLLMDAKTVLDKLKIVNFWHCLDSDGVKLWKGKFTQVYKRPSASNDRKAADQFARVQKAIESDLLAMEALREDAETEYVYVGLAAGQQFKPRPLKQQPVRSVPKRTRGNGVQAPSLRPTPTKFTIEPPKMDGFG